MIRINELTLKFDHSDDDIRKAVLRTLKIQDDQLVNYSIIRKAIDARHKNSIKAIYTIDADVNDQDKILTKHSGNHRICKAPETNYICPELSYQPDNPPVVVGSGPCGLFAALLLAQAGLNPILIERGQPVEQRIRDVKDFWNNGTLNPESNVQFGEGGAGTFSDGKLTTQVKDKSNRSRKVLDEFVEAGAPQEVLFQAKPHIGTDNLIRIVKHIRNKIISLGGQVRFSSCLTGIVIENGSVTHAVINGQEQLPTSDIILALGHSARDTFQMIHDQNVEMTAKNFSIGVRIEHHQSAIDQAMYGKYAGHPKLGAADYKLVHHCSNGRSAYSFCMCPGGQVIASASEPGKLVTNGMSVYARNTENANSALLVGVGPEDFESDHPLAGIEFQRKWEEKAFQLGGGNYNAPVQLAGDFLADKPSDSLGTVKPSYTPSVTPCDLRECLPPFVSDTLKEAISGLGKKLKGFADPNAVLTALESRSSSPVRISRDSDGQSPGVRGLFPAGEGAGYAGGIMSAAIDGIKAAEAVITKA